MDAKLLAYALIILGLFSCTISMKSNCPEQKDGFIEDKECKDTAEIFNGGVYKCSHKDHELTLAENLNNWVICKCQRIKK